MNDQANQQTIIEKGVKAVDMLYEAMLFWREEGMKIVKELKLKLNEEGEGKLAAKLGMIWRDVDDRWIDIAAKLAPYQTPKLSSTEIKNEITVKHVIRAQTRAKDHKEWLERVEEDKKYLPKPDPQVERLSIDSDTIDEIEYQDINEDEGDNIEELR